MKLTKRILTLMIAVALLAMTAGGALAAKIKITAPMRIRKGPGMKYSTVAVVGSGRVFNVKKAHSTDGTLWFRITSGQYKGRYVSSQHSTTVSKSVKVKVRATGTVYFRKRPTKYSTLIRQFGAGKKLLCTGYRNGWFKIRYKGTTGYIYGYRLEPA